MVWYSNLFKKLRSEEMVHRGDTFQMLLSKLQAEKPNKMVGAGVEAVLHLSDYEEIPHVQEHRRSCSKMVGGAKLSLESNNIPARNIQRVQTSLVRTRAQRPHTD